MEQNTAEIKHVAEEDPFAGKQYLTNPVILKDEIVYFERAVPSVNEIVEIIEDLVCESVTDWEDWKTSNGHIYGKIKHLKRSKYHKLDKDSRIKSKYVIETLCDSMIQCAREYGKLMGVPDDHIHYASGILKRYNTAFGVNKYNTNSPMGAHVDLNEENFFVQYTIVIYLNDNYEGGELHFKNHDVTVKPKAGDIMMYPSGHPYVHESLDITKGNKMLITHHLRWMGDKSGQ